MKECLLYTRDQNLVNSNGFNGNKRKELNML